jgi:hypothetical protein
LDQPGHDEVAFAAWVVVARKSVRGSDLIILS